MAEVKHIHVFAEDFEENKTKLTATSIFYLDGSVSQISTEFILPDESSKLEKFANDLFDVEKPPSNVFPDEGLSSKAIFKKKIVNYTIAIATKNNNYDEINTYYDSLLNSQEAQDQIVIDYNAVFESLEAINKTKEENVDLYKASLEGERPEFSGDIENPELSHEDPEDIMGNERAQASIPAVQFPEDELKTKQNELFGDKPTEGNQRPSVQREGMSFEKTKVFVDLPPKTILTLNGVGGARLIEPVDEPVIYPGDGFLKSENNSGIICSRDELYRPRGHTGSGAVYMYAGRKGSSESQLASFSNPKLDKKKEPNNLIADSAYVYISQKSDVDSLFKNKLARGTYSKTVKPLTKKGEIETRQGISLVAIKADDVLVQSRYSGIRLIAGTDKKKSDGGDTYSKFGIDLIAGNDDGDLQPLVKGNNLVNYLSSISKSIDELRAVLYDFINAQSKFNNIVASHTHYDQFGIMLGVAGSNNPFAINGGKGRASGELNLAGATSLLETIRQQYNTVTGIMNKIGNDVNGLQRMGAYKILSEKNRTN